ncbi:hypothetical protein BKA62DRAFT_152880 [Auriculariales sp. MPI-PUGE-AT-0066]|nr:hypothetical protein BKA62DRAFT_152880 [Auriculariales sp. MPI-PUGE-AT-0066]
MASVLGGCPPASMTGDDPSRKPHARNRMRADRNHNFCEPLKNGAQGYLFLCLFLLCLASLPLASAKLSASCRDNDCLQANGPILCLRPNDAPNIPATCTCAELEPQAHEHRLNVMNEISLPVQYYNKTTGKFLGNADFSVPSSDPHFNSILLVVCAFGLRRDARGVTRCWDTFGDSDFNKDYDGCECTVVHKREPRMPPSPCWKNFEITRTIGEFITQATTKLFQSTRAMLNVGLGAV